MATGRIQAREALASVRVAHLVRGTSRKLVAIIDTGATTSVIRRDIAEELRLPIVDTRVSVYRPVVGEESAGFAETESVILRIYYLNGADRERRVVTALLSEVQSRDEMLIGMDALEGGVLTVDLVRGEWSWRVTPLPSCQSPGRTRAT